MFFVAHLVSRFTLLLSSQVFSLCPVILVSTTLVPCLGRCNDKTHRFFSGGSWATSWVPFKNQTGTFWVVGKTLMFFLLKNPFETAWNSWFRSPNFFRSGRELPKTTSGPTGFPTSCHCRSTEVYQNSWKLLSAVNWKWAARNSYFQYLLVSQAYWLVVYFLTVITSRNPDPYRVLEIETTWNHQPSYNSTLTKCLYGGRSHMKNISWKFKSTKPGSPAW